MEDPMKVVVVGVDFSPLAQRALQCALELSAPHGAEVVLVHVAAPDPDFVGMEAGPQSARDDVARELKEERAALHELAREVETSGRRVQMVMVRGAAATSLVEVASASKADLLVVGSHGKGPVKRLFLGSVSEGVLRHAPCPVLVVPELSLGEGVG
jgi:nucleotide-binding universal stress UspA family protein